MQVVKITIAINSIISIPCFTACTFSFFFDRKDLELEMYSKKLLISRYNEIDINHIGD